MNHEQIFDDIVSELKKSTSQVKQNEAELRIYIRDMIRMHVQFIAGDRDSIAHKLLFRCTLGRDIETWNASNKDILDIDAIVNEVDIFLFGESKRCPAWLPGLGTVVLLRKAAELYYQHDLGRDSGYLRGLYQVLLAAMPYVNVEGLKGLEQRFTFAYPRDVIR